MGFGNRYFNLWLFLNEKDKEKKKAPAYYQLIANQLKLFSLPPLKLELTWGRPCGNKKINGRKRTILVDTLGLPLAIKVSPANMSDNEAGIEALEELKGTVPRMQKITAEPWL